MFPVAFADSVVERFTKPGDLVLDPFAGRGTAIFSAAVRGRSGIGIELNPVGWVYGKTKLSPASYELVAKRLQEIDVLSASYGITAKNLPEFFEHCYCLEIRKFLLAARENLDWRKCRVDRTCMAILMVYLHGKREASLSNQMMQTKSMSPDYAIAWWKGKNLKPPEFEPIDFLSKRLEWRYAKGVPSIKGSDIYLDDSVKRLPKIYKHIERSQDKRISLVLTSPPYYNITNYHYDQWLRLWLLGGDSHPRNMHESYRGKFSNREKYRILLKEVFSQTAKMMNEEGVIYVRTDNRTFTYETTVNVLSEIFPQKKIHKFLRPVSGRTQTDLFNKANDQLGEVDLVLISA